MTLFPHLAVKQKSCRASCRTAALAPSPNRCTRGRSSGGVLVSTNSDSNQISVSKGEGRREPAEVSQGGIVDAQYKCDRPLRGLRRASCGAARRLSPGCDRRARAEGDRRAAV